MVGTVTLSRIGVGTDGWQCVNILWERWGCTGEDYTPWLLFGVALWNKLRLLTEVVVLIVVAGAVAGGEEDRSSGDSNEVEEGDEEVVVMVVGRCITCSGLSRLAMEASSNSIRTPSSSNSYNFIKY